ncbi:hypothetical protein DRW48_10580 [Paracoccus suum]|uniref:Uncharacterized protein n=1 Tax=Paracoccus suum TaxID=2259340 RepID=A0A344PL25_9RHOB|nr:hypothetical protein [Paracoccus suum]AXC50080.1 hypothetical protein DRW48_10580 [Paracoccus suum]
MILNFGTQARPAGLSTLEQVMQIRDQAVAAAKTAADDAVADVGRRADDAVTAAEQASRDAAEASQRIVDAAATAGSGISSASLSPSTRALTLNRPLMPSVVVPLEPEFRGFTATEYATRDEALAAKPPTKAKFLWVNGLLYQRDSSGAALQVADGTKWSPAINCTPMHFGAVGDGVADDTVPIEKALEWMGAADGRPQLLDGLNKFYALSRTIAPTGFRERSFRFANIKPHSTWVSRWPGDGNSIWPISGPNGIVAAFGSVLKPGEIASPKPEDYATYPFFYLGVGLGGFTLDTISFDGRDANKQPAADFVLYHGGSNTLSRLKGRGCANFGVWVAGGTDGAAQDLKISQWNLTDVENGQHAKRTAAALVLGTGDITWRNNIGRYCKYPLVVYGTGASQLIGDHYYNGARDGDVLTTGKTYGRLVYKGAFPVFSDCYTDKCISRFEEPRVQDRNTRHLTSGAAINDPFYYELVPRAPNTKLNGLMIVNGDFQGTKTGNSDSLLPGDFFRIDAWGSHNYFVGPAQMVVADNVYHVGTNAGVSVPSTRGTVVQRVLPTTWAASSGAYKSGIVELADRLFLPNALDYSIVYSVSASSTQASAPYALPNIRMQRLGRTQVQFWCDTNPDVHINIMWHSVGQSLS